MPALIWEDAYATGVNKIDEEHKQLIEMINEAHDCYVVAGQPDAMAKVATRMTDYAESHFATEERLMGKFNYPDLALHKSQHQYFRTKAAFLSSKKDKDTPDPLELFQMLSLWLIDHIMNTDKLLGAFLNRNDVH